MIYGKFAASQRADVGIGPYNISANPYYPANFDSEADSPQSFKRSNLQIQLSHNRRRVPYCPFSPPIFSGKAEKMGLSEAAEPSNMQMFHVKHEKQ